MSWTTLSEKLVYLTMAINFVWIMTEWKWADRVEMPLEKTQTLLCRVSVLLSIGTNKQPTQVGTDRGPAVQCGVLGQLYRQAKLTVSWCHSGLSPPRS